MSKLHFRLLLASTIASCFGAMAYPAVGYAQDPSNLQAEPLAVPAPSSSSPSDSVSKVGSLNHHQWLRLSADGSIWGSLGTPAGENQIRQSGVEVVLVQKGQQVASVVTADDGSFRFNDLQPGVYSLVAHNPSTLAIMSLTLLDASAGKHLPTGIQIRTLTPATDRVVSLIRGGSIPRASGPIQLDKDPVGSDRSFWNSGRIAIDEEGGIKGRVTVPGGNFDMSNTQIYLTHSGNEIARTRSDREGNYRFDNIPPGNYGFVASGPAGIAAMGFVAVGKGTGGADSSTSISQDGSKFVHASVQQDAVPALNVELASCDCFGAPMMAESVLPLEGSCCPLPMAGCCGAAGGGYGGGGGGGGGGIGGGFGGGLLPLALIGGLTAAGIAVADDNKDSNVVVSPITP